MRIWAQQSRRYQPCEQRPIDAIAYAWKACNPRVPMPDALRPDATPSALAFGLSNIRHIRRPIEQREAA